MRCVPYQTVACTGGLPSAFSSSAEVYGGTSLPPAGVSALNTFPNESAIGVGRPPNGRFAGDCAGVGKAVLLTEGVE